MQHSTLTHRLTSLAALALTAIVLCLGSLLISATATAQTAHLIPKEARKGRIIARQFPIIEIDGDLYRLSPGARIFNAEKRTVTPIHIPPKAEAKYLLDRNGQVKMIWLLGEEK